MKESLSEQKRVKNRAKTGVCEISQPLRNRHFAAKPVRSLRPLSAKIFAAAKPLLAHECHFAAQESPFGNPPFRSCETAANHQSMKDPIFAGKAPFRRGFLSCEATFWHTSVISQHSDPHFAAAKSQSVKTPNFAGKAPFRRVFRDCETIFWHTSAIL